MGLWNRNKRDERGDRFDDVRRLYAQNDWERIKRDRRKEEEGYERNRRLGDAEDERWHGGTSKRSPHKILLDRYVKGGR